MRSDQSVPHWHTIQAMDASPGLLTKLQYCKPYSLINLVRVISWFEISKLAACVTVKTSPFHNLWLIRIKFLNSRTDPFPLRYRMGLPYRKTAELFRELFGLQFVPASALGFDRKAAARGTPIYEDLGEKIRASDVVHADETSWRSDGVGHFVWFAGNENLAFFHIDRHRSAEVAKTIFGEDFDGTLVRDRYAAYNGIGVDWQVCLAHIITNAKKISGEHALLPQTEKDTATGPFCDRVRDLCARLCEVGQKLQSGHIPRKAAAKIKKRSVMELNQICKQLLRFKPAETLRTYLAGPEQKFLFTFLRRPGVPATNNHAEQSLRHLVIFRKICFGTRSDSGLKTHSILPSLVQTARRQGVHPRKFLQTLLTADTATAQAALYNNLS